MNVVVDDWVLRALVLERAPDELFDAVQDDLLYTTTRFRRRLTRALEKVGEGGSLGRGLGPDVRAAALRRIDAAAGLAAAVALREGERAIAATCAEVEAPVWREALGACTSVEGDFCGSPRNLNARVLDRIGPCADRQGIELLIFEVG